MAVRLLDYAASLVPTNNWGLPEMQAHQLSGALSQLSITELAEVANLIDQRTAAAGDLPALIEETPALRCLPAPLVCGGRPGEDWW